MSKLHKCRVDVLRWVASLRGGSPFDIGLFFFSLLSPTFFLLPWDLNMAQGMFFVFGIFALFGLAFLSPKQRMGGFPVIGIIVLWSLVNVFIHTFRFSLNSTYAAKFINFCLLSEGFIYILCACILFCLVVNFRKKFNIFYPLVVINILNLFFAITQSLGLKLIWSNNHTISGMMGTCSQLSVFSAMTLPVLINTNPAWGIIPIICMFLSKSYTGMGALFLATAIYLKITKQYIRLYTCLVIGSAFILFNFKSMWGKLIIRPEVWWITIKEIIRSPFIGLGFDNSLANNMVYSKVNVGWTFRHNDYLNIARDLGLPFMIILIIGVWKIMKKSRLNYLSVAILTLLIASFFQTSMYFSRIAGTAIILLALKYSESYA